jgi:hypothetical protein
VTLPKTGALNMRATMMVTKTLLIAAEGWGGARVLRAYDKKTGAVVGELPIPGMMGSMPMTYMLNGKQYLAFTVGTQTQPARSACGLFVRTHRVSPYGKRNATYSPV